MLIRYVKTSLRDSERDIDHSVLDAATCNERGAISTAPGMRPRPNDPETLEPPQKTLYHLAETFMGVAAPIDLGWSSGDIEDTFPMARFEFLKI